MLELEDIKREIFERYVTKMEKYSTNATQHYV